MKLQNITFIDEDCSNISENDLQLFLYGLNCLNRSVQNSCQFFQLILRNTWIFLGFITYMFFVRDSGL